MHSVVTRRQLLSVAGTATGIAAACRRQRSETKEVAPGPVTLVWAFWGGQERVTIRDEQISTFQREHPSVTIERVHTTGSVDEHFDKVQVMLAGGSQLDLFMSSPIWIPNLALKELYLDLNGLMARDKFPVGEYAPAALDAFAYLGKQYSMPELVNFGVIYYNKGLFERAGVSSPQDDWTWEQFLTAAQRLTTRRGSDVDVWGAWPVKTDLNNTMPWIWMNGGQILDDEQDPKRSTMSTPAVVDALEWRANWAHKHRVAPSPADTLPAGNAFSSGLVAMNVSTATAVPNLVASIQGFAWDAAPLPRGERGHINFAGSAGQGIARQSKLAHEAWSVLRFLASPDGLRPLARDQAGLPPHRGLAATEYLQLTTPPTNRRAMVKTLDVLRALPKAPFMLETYYQVYGAQLNGIYDGKVGAREACTAIDDQVSEYLRRAGG